MISCPRGGEEGASLNMTFHDMGEGSPKNNVIKKGVTKNVAE